MAKYNLREDVCMTRYGELTTLQDLIDDDNEFCWDLSLPYDKAQSEFNIENCYKKIAEYLEEPDFKNIICICDVNGVECQEDYDEFTNKYCKSSKPEEHFVKDWYQCYKGVNRKGDKYVSMETEGAWTYAFTEVFKEKYINKK